MGRKPNLKAREHILDIACNLFHEKGFNGVSVDDVALAAGIKKPNLFHYFPSKQELGLAVFDYAAKAYKESVVLQFAEPGVDPIEAVASLFSRTSDTMKANNCSHGCFIGNLAQAMSDQNEVMRERLAEYFSSWTRQLSGLFDRAKASGYFNAEFEPESSAEAVVSIYEGALLCCKARRQVSCLDSASAMVRKYLEGFRKPALAIP